MILADTSVWINHFRQPIGSVLELVTRQALLMHPFVVGELCMGSLRNRAETLEFLDDLPASEVASENDVRGLVEREKLFSIGLGYIDAHLLASALITPDCSLWALDKRLHDVCERLGRNTKLLR